MSLEVTCVELNNRHRVEQHSFRERRNTFVGSKMYKNGTSKLNILSFYIVSNNLRLSLQFGSHLKSPLMSFQGYKLLENLTIMGSPKISSF